MRATVMNLIAEAVSIVMIAVQYVEAAGCVFFQAEYGIRDSSVTGVQTCALPISTSHVVPNPTVTTIPVVGVAPEFVAPPEIGRASCRERVLMPGEAAAFSIK